MRRLLLPRRFRSWREMRHQRLSSVAQMVSRDEKGSRILERGYREDYRELPRLRPRRYFTESKAPELGKARDLDPSKE